MDHTKNSMDLGWIHLAQASDKWQALVNTVMTFGFNHH
jgi:hypothetical protein